MYQATGILALPDVICPVCLETYSDPRTLQCGHSLCYSCLAKMREVSKNCRCSGLYPLTQLDYLFRAHSPVLPAREVSQLQAGIEDPTSRLAH